MQRRFRFALGNLLASTFWLALWMGAFVMAYRMFRLKLPGPLTYSLGFLLWAILVAAPIVGLAALVGRTKAGLQMAGVLILCGVLMAITMLAGLIF